MAMINYHIITGSKGGVGKSLLSLMRLKFALDTAGEDGSRSLVIIIDLNNMNTDIRRSLDGYFSKGDQQLEVIEFGGISEICPTCGGKIPNIAREENSIELRKTTYFEGNRHSLVVGYLTNPFLILGSNEFSQVLKHTREYAEEQCGKHNYTKVEIIVDTNFHFCNLFSDDRQANSYSLYKQVVEKTTTSIYFLWTFNQFCSVISRNGHNSIDEDEILKNTVNTVLEKLGDNIRFVHVYTPVALIDSKPRPGDRMMRTIFQGLFGNNTVIPIVGLIGVIDESRNRPIMKRLPNINFDDWIKSLSNSFDGQVRDEANEGNSNRSNFILALADSFKAQNYPCNVIIFANFEKALEGYTDGDTDSAANILTKLGGTESYSDFRKLNGRNLPR